jgi:hypothetical protein
MKQEDEWFETKSPFPYICTIFADYYQFYIQDEQMDEDTPDDWGDQLTTQMRLILEKSEAACLRSRRGAVWG